VLTTHGAWCDVLATHGACLSVRSVPDECPAEVKALISACTQLDARARPTASEVYVVLQQQLRQQMQVGGPVWRKSVSDSMSLMVSARRVCLSVCLDLADVSSLTGLHLPSAAATPC
jgi:hypothetical protein